MAELSKTQSYFLFANMQRSLFYDQASDRRRLVCLCLCESKDLSYYKYYLEWMFPHIISKKSLFQNSDATSTAPANR